MAMSKGSKKAQKAPAPQAAPAKKKPCSKKGKGY